MKQKTTQHKVAHSLSHAIQTALDSYQNFNEGGEQDSEHANNFKNHHAACKAALAHIEALLKLLNMVDALNDDDQHNLQEMIKRAHAELRKG